MFAGIFLRQEPGRPGPKPLATGTGVDRSLQIKETGQDAGDVRFDDRDCLAESEGCYGVGGVASDTRQRANRIRRAWETPSMLLHNGQCGRPEISRTGIIAEPLPGMENVVLRGRGESGNGGEAAQPFIIIRNDRRDLGLLEHEFGNEDRVGIIGPAPWEIAAIRAVPGEKPAAEGRIRFDEENVQRLPAPRQ